MRAESDKFEALFIWLTVDQNDIGPDMAVTITFPVAGKSMIVEFGR
jgi:hypothetical protein